MKINWEESTCIHAGECCKNSPDVFKVVNDQFVIDATAANEDEIRATIAKCPSGALSMQAE